MEYDSNIYKKIGYGWPRIKEEDVANFTEEDIIANLAEGEGDMVFVHGTIAVVGEQTTRPLSVREYLPEYLKEHRKDLYEKYRLLMEK